ncbi:hypothetical protein Ade02nite_81510 [Paractinoplanes deccanensis]|uniref:Uncharacterized protein n=1 Tax=Paractinoplanes deccanensis TaxID=113561 RepID=A0ABQ3YHW0_9ACTN|nr:hypothetical protein Ade02nite_81510 [Actinoplanes deccanensis]
MVAANPETHLTQDTTVLDSHRTYSSAEALAPVTPAEPLEPTVTEPNGPPALPVQQVSVSPAQATFGLGAPAGRQGSRRI